MSQLLRLFNIALARRMSIYASIKISWVKTYFVIYIFSVLDERKFRIFTDLMQLLATPMRTLADQKFTQTSLYRGHNRQSAFNANALFMNGIVNAGFMNEMAQVIHLTQANT